MEDLKKFLGKYCGDNYRIIVAIVILATRLYDVIIGNCCNFPWTFIGNYVQQNKDDVKTKLKDMDRQDVEKERK